MNVVEFPRDTVRTHAGTAVHKHSFKSQSFQANSMEFPVAEWVLPPPSKLKKCVARFSEPNCLWGLFNYK